MVAGDPQQGQQRKLLTLHFSINPRVSSLRCWPCCGSPGTIRQGQQRKLLTLHFSINPSVGAGLAPPASSESERRDSPLLELTSAADLSPPRLFLLHQSRNPHQNHRPNKGNDNRSDHSACMQAHYSKHPPAHNSAQNPKNNIYHNSIASAFHHLPRQPPGDQAHHNRINEAFHDSSSAL